MRLHDVVASAEREDARDELTSCATIVVRLFRGDDGPEAGELGKYLFFCILCSDSLKLYILLFQSISFHFF